MPTYTKNPDGSFTEIPESPVITGAKQFLASAAHEASPATLHQAMQGLGAQIPAAIPLTGLAALYVDPDAINHIVAAVATGNPIAIAGTLAGVAITAYSTFTTTQLKGLTDAQIQTDVNNLTESQLNDVLAKLRSQSPTAINSSSQ